jgi:alkylation response protein AidB-like acyl-CoA dehydrogenase
LNDAIGALPRVIDEVVAPAAAEADREGAFPRAGIAALAEGGILGLTTSADLGGGGKSLGEAASVIEALAAACGSTAMVVLMHFAAVAVLEASGPEEVRRAVGSGVHLSTLAFSEVGSRSHFWAPLGTATEDNGAVRLDARKSWVTSAGHADSYVWSSRPVRDAGGPMTLWLVPGTAEGLHGSGGFDGLGLRANSSTPVAAENVRIPPEAMLGADGGGLDLALSTALPWFLVLSAAFSLGLMEAVTRETLHHATATQLEHLGQTLMQQPVIRSDVARMRIQTDAVRALVNDTLSALGAGRQDAMLRVLEVKAAAAEAALAVTDLAMKVCGGSAFRKELGVERAFRDARAARVMAPTTDALLDFVGRALAGMPLLEAS